MLLNIFIYVLFINLLLTQPCYAYIDPGTGSFLTQVIAATIIGVVASVNVFWINIKKFFLKIINKKDTKMENIYDEKH